MQNLLQQYHDDEAREKLAQLGIEAGTLRTAVILARQSASMVTEYAPRTKAGTDFWGGVVEHVRRVQARDGWAKRDDDNWPTVERPDGRVAVAFSSADAKTGHPRLIPSTRNPKGRATRYALDQNQGTLTDLSPDFPSPKLQPTETWMFIYHIDKYLKQIRMELSLPQPMPAFPRRARVDSWLSRIFIDPFDWSLPVDIDAGEPPEIDVYVARRSGT